jgi:hypothetical protein
MRAGTARRRLGACVLAVTAALALGACGSTEEEDVVDGDFAIYTAEDVIVHVEQLTGLRLVAGEFSSPGQLFLGPRDEDRLSVLDRYGNLTVAVYEDRSLLEAVARPDQLVVENLVVDLPAGAPEQSERLRRIFATLGTPVDEIDRPPEEIPCEEAEIEPEGGEGSEGTCRLRLQTLQIVDADGELTLPQARLSGPRVDRGAVLTTVTGERIAASGVFVGLSLEVENTGSGPLEFLRPNLVVDGRRYSDDFETTLDFKTDALPLDPGEEATVRVMFDLPEEAAARARERGAVEVASDDLGGSPDNALNVARVRLAESGELEDGPDGDGGRITGAP